MLATAAGENASAVDAGIAEEVFDGVAVEAAEGEGNGRVGAESLQVAFPDRGATELAVAGVPTMGSAVAVEVVDGEDAVVSDATVDAGGAEAGKDEAFRAHPLALASGSFELSASLAVRGIGELTASTPFTFPGATVELGGERGGHGARKLAQVKRSREVGSAKMVAKFDPSEPGTARTGGVRREPVRIGDL